MDNKQFTEGGNLNLPSGWEVKSLSEVFEYINTPSFSRDNLTHEKTKKEVLYIHYGDIHAKYKSELLDFDVEKSIPFLKDEFYSDNFNFLKEGDLVIADASEDYAGVGESIEIKNIGHKKVIGGLHTLVIRDKEGKTANGFRTYLFRNNIVHNEIKKMATGISVYGISKGNLSKLKLPLPPLPEQKAIAQVLSTMDKAIQLTSQLIAQKELRKKWLMQNLLTGKKILRGYDGAWKEVLLKDCFRFIKSYSISRDGLSKENGGIYCIHYGDIHAFYETAFLDFKNQKSIPRIIDNKFTPLEKDYLKNGDVIMADASEDYEGVGEAVLVTNLNEKIAIGGLHTVVLRDFTGETVDNFRAYLFSSEKVKNELRKKATGTSVYSVTKTTLESLILNLPPIETQTAIAQILQAADKEIELLKAKAEKLKEQKRGMMQVLLTGKKRLTIG